MGKLHVIERKSLLDVPGKLRQLADRIEELGEEFSVVVVIGRPNGNVAVRAYGQRTSPLEMCGWLARWQTALTDGCEEDPDIVPTKPLDPTA